MLTVFETMDSGLSDDTKIEILCTKVQELSMTTVLDPNVHTYCGNYYYFLTGR